ncbi:Chromodomain-helicase-DNA-binding protein 1 [Fasciolopsis buskii]|uniref:Chromodomain-helicase-DNA-binding protein 1 n=1 Tax=Fasciolopsis buskii TaxID=27845 RepID=A0A8E0S271_9TREM|nr:Chromodomain-helicase-DNA-binding protein 1 [Fasciolopsis buski]
MRLQHLLDSIRSISTPARHLVTQNDLESAGLENITLRAHQLHGVSWLKECVSQNRGGILCDEMGLGKTCQTIGFFTSVFEEAPKTSALVVTPLSVIQNWTAELEKFAPGIHFTLYLGDKATRAEHRSGFSLEQTPVILTSFETALNDEAFFARYRWDILVVDEGHRLKNSESLLYKSLEETCQGLRFILTGTPVQNNLVELYNLLHFVAPKYFPMSTLSEFVNYFDGGGQASEDRLDAMNQLLRPFLLRRTKRQVLPDLPPRLDFLLYHPLSRTQTEIYRALLTRNPDVLSAVISSATNSTAPINRIQNTIMQLRKCVNHPYLFDGVEPEPFELGEHLINASGKLVLLDTLLSHLFNPWQAKSDTDDMGNTVVRPPVHKVLIFSQMTRMLDVIQDYLTLKDYTYERLDGSVRGEERHLAVEEFNKSKEVFIFLLSTRAGGQGLNLHAADTVILVDSDFNPQNDLQATARAHRIGQTKPVRIIRLVGRNTVEEAILARADMKLKLTAEVLGSADTALTAEDTSNVSAEELLKVLKFGLARLFEDYKLETGDNFETGTHDGAANVLENGTRQKTPPNFAKILGETDPHTGNWLEPAAQLSSSDAEGHTDFVVLTDKPFQCEPNEEDQEFLVNLKSNLNNMEDTDAVPTRRVTRKPLTKEQLAERNKKRLEALRLRKMRNEENQARRTAAILERRKAKWDAAGYQSLSVYQTEELADDEETFEEQVEMYAPEFGVSSEENTQENCYPPGIYYKTGDASEPLTVFDNTIQSGAVYIPSFVCISLDDSGHWGSGGFFSALNGRSKAPSTAYELAGEMDDLELGTCHLVPELYPSCISNTEESGIKTFADWLLTRSAPYDSPIRANFCAILVAQKHNRRSQSRGSPPDLQLDALESALFRLAKACRTVRECSVHLPRLGHGTHAFEWYTVERLLHKHLVRRAKVPVFVYPFSNGSKRGTI